MQYITELFRLNMRDKLRAVFMKRLDECKNGPRGHDPVELELTGSGD